VIPLSAFFPRLLPSVIGCPEPLAQQALLDSAIEFCERSLAVTTTLDAVTLAAGEASFEVETQRNTTIAQVLNLWFDGRQIDPSPYSEATEIASTNGEPRYFYGQDIDEIFNITLMPAPDRTVQGGVIVRAALKPTRTATTVHNILFERHAQAIVDGALAILMAIPDQSFSNDQKAMVMGSSARAKANAARTDALYGRVQSSMSVKMRAF
jgi:hypothetical protein